MEAGFTRSRIATQPASGFSAFVGRDEELAFLSRHFNAARNREGSVVLIVSPPGGGRSRLLREFRKSLGTSAKRFALGGNLHRNQSPLAPFKEALGDAFLQSLFEPSTVSVVAIEDLQWADDATLELVGRICRHTDELPLLLLLTLQTQLFEGNDWAPALANLLRSLNNVIRLDPLSTADVRSLMKHVVTAYPKLSAEMIRLIERRCGGNPLYLQELVRATVDALDQGHNPGLIVPSTLESTVLQKLASLPVTIRNTLATAAVLGTSFDARILASLLKQHEAAVMKALQTAYEKRFIVPSDGEAYCYEFAHPLIRDVVYARLTPSLRALTHRAAAVALEHLATGAEHPEKLSDHWFASDEPKRSVDYAERAAAKAEATGDYAEAARLYDRVFGFTEEGSPLRAEICRKLATALYFAGSVAQSRPYFEEAAAFYAATGAPHTAAELLRFLAMALWHDGNGAAALALIDDALSHLDKCADSVATCHLLVKAAGFCDLLGMRHRSMELLERARTLPCRKPRSLEVRYRNVRACCLAHERRIPEAIAEFETALKLSKNMRNPGLVVPIAQNASACLRSAGRFREAETRARSALKFARKQQAGPLLESTLALVHAALLSMCGQLAEATVLVEQVIAANPDFALYRMELVAFGLPIALSVDRQDLVDVCFDESSMETVFSSRVSSAIGMVAYAASRLCYVKGSVKQARSLLHRGLGAVESAEFVESLMLAIAEYGAATDFKRARVLLADLPASIATPAFLALFDAFVAHRASKMREGQRLAKKAADIFQQLGALQLAARSHELAGHQRRALTMYRQAGAVRDAKRLESVFEGRGRRSSGILTERQIEIGRFIAAGECNRTIARDLKISAKTLESHLTAIYRRLGVASRSGIAAYMLDRDKA